MTPSASDSKEKNNGRDTRLTLRPVVLSSATDSVAQALKLTTDTDH